MARQPTPIDVHVGQRIRQRRRTANLTQQQLGNALGLTFQQIQKYERGANRVSASMLYETARTFGVPISYFFEGLDEAASGRALEDEREIRAFLATAEGLDLARGFARIERGPIRRRILELVRAVADPEAE